MVFNITECVDFHHGKRIVITILVCGHDVVIIMHKEGDALLIQQPVYCPFREVIEDNGRIFVNNQLHYEDGKYTIDFEDFEKKIVDNNVKVFILCNPHNPVGRVWTKEELENKIATFTGGRAAEELIFHSITTGASNDIEQATKLARAMISRYGMSEDFDMVAMENVSNQYLGGDSSLSCSFETQTILDKKVVELVRTEHQKALQILQDNIGKLHELAKYLYEHETITGEEFMKILEAPALTPAAAQAGAVNLTKPEETEE